MLNERLFDQEFGHLLRTAEQTYAEELNENRLSFVTFKQVPWHPIFPVLPLSSRSLPSGAVLGQQSCCPCLSNTRIPQLIGKELSLRLITEGSSALGKIATDRGMLYRPIPL